MIWSITELFSLKRQIQLFIAKSQGCRSEARHETIHTGWIIRPHDYWNNAVASTTNVTQVCNQMKWLCFYDVINKVFWVVNIKWLFILTKLITIDRTHHLLNQINFFNETCRIRFSILRNLYSVIIF